MINSVISAIESAQLRTDLPEYRVGDTVKVHYKIVEGEKDRTQVFQGVVLKRHRAGARSTFTVRKVSFGVGVERVFLQHSPRIEKLEILSRGVVRRSRLFFLRDLAGKAARLKDEKDKLSLVAARGGPRRVWLDVCWSVGGHRRVGDRARRRATSRARREPRVFTTDSVVRAP